MDCAFIRLMRERPRGWTLWRDQRGIALPMAIMVLMALTALTAGLLSIGSSEVLIAHNHLRSTHARYLAEAGLEDAFDWLRSDESRVTGAPSSLTAMTGLSGPGSTLSAYGSYSVQYRKMGDNTVLAAATGTSQTGNGQKVLKALITNGFVTTDAIRTKDKVKIIGNPTVTGACGNVHTNGDLDISGNPTISGNATASDSYSVSGNATVGPGSGGGKPKKTVPVVRVADFLAKARATVAASELYQFKSDGKVLDGNDTVITTLNDGDTYRGWKYDSGPTAKWTFSNNTAYDGTYSFEGNVKVSGNPGSTVTPWKVTIIATKDIEVSGNPHLKVHSIDTLLAGEDDIKISGDLTQHSAGVIAVREHIEISDNPTIIGYIVGENGNAIPGGNLSIKENKISGNPTLTFDCGLNPPLRGPLQILAWGL